VQRERRGEGRGGGERRGEREGEKREGRERIVWPTAGDSIA